MFKVFGSTEEHVCGCRYLVVDEADKLFELGFMEQLDSILAAATHPDITRALFSATLPERVRRRGVSR